MFGGVKLTKNVDPDKYSYSGYEIGFDSCSHFSLLNFDFAKYVITFGVDNISSVHGDNRKNILGQSKGPTQELDDTTITAGAECSINFSRSRKNFCLSLHYDGRDRFLFVNVIRMYQFKAKHSEIKPYPLCLGNISKDFSVNNMKKSTVKWICVQFFY